MHYVEDILENLFKYDITFVESKDFEILINFFEKYQSNLLLTDNQKYLLIKIFKKYQDRFQSRNFDYSDLLNNPIWKTKSRIIDKRKRLYVKSNKDNECYIWINFPYEFKETFSKSNFDNSLWDPDEGARRFKISDVDLISLHEFCSIHGFSIENSFYDLYFLYEEIMIQQNNILPRSIIKDGNVELLNACEEAVDFWKIHKKNIHADDLLLAKSMGFPLMNPTMSAIEKIASSDSMMFRMKNLYNFFDICKQISGKIVVILSEKISYHNWLQEFIDVAELCDYDIGSIKICFREKNDKNKSFNQWIKDKGMGGEIKNGKIYIFLHRPAKWIFKLDNEIKLIATNNNYIPVDYITKEWFKNNPVIYLNETQLRKNREEEANFVDL